MNLNPNYLEVVLNLPIQKSFHYIDNQSGIKDSFGCRVKVPFGSRIIIGFVINCTQQHPKNIDPKIQLKEINRIIDKEPIFNADILKMAHWLKSYYFCSLGQALSTIIPSGKRKVEIPNSNNIIKDEPILTLRESQQKIYDDIKKGIDNNNGEKYLLHGVTGSGKTEIYRHAALYALKQNKQVIILVPEISLTPQTISRFHSVFKNKIAVLHSRVTPAQRITEWKRILKNEAKIIIGARSAIFAPATNLGLIIIDEEHESSYKAGDCPRYHARQVAFYRTSKTGCLLLGSATPSLETLYHAQNKTINLLSLTEKISKHQAPNLNIINMEDEPEGAIVSLTLLKEIEKVKKQGNQTILFLNRRGFSPYLICKSCDAPIKCPHCSISLSLHKKSNTLLCHYCGYAIRYKNVCPDCNNKKIIVCGAGTERIEDFLKKRLPKLNIERMDSDTISKKGSLIELLKRFSEKKIDILIGTQMITKGLDFPDVTLVGVLSADTEINMPDFRSYERTYSQLMQVIGRCGRSEKIGTALLQTFLPNEDPIQSIINNDFSGFIKRELERRNEIKYPPYSRLIRIITRSKNKESAITSINQITADLKNKLTPNTQLLGPVSCPILKISGNYRYQIILKTDIMKELIELLRQTGLHEGTKGDVYYEIDVDPINMM